MMVATIVWLAARVVYVLSVYILSMCTVNVWLPCASKAGVELPNLYFLMSGESILIVMPVQKPISVPIAVQTFPCLPRIGYVFAVFIQLLFSSSFRQPNPTFERGF